MLFNPRYCKGLRLSRFSYFGKFEAAEYLVSAIERSHNAVKDWKICRIVHGFDPLAREGGDLRREQGLRN